MDSFLYVKWCEAGDEPPGWYRARVDRYFLAGRCKIVYDDEHDYVVSEIVHLNHVGWRPCSRRARKFVPLRRNPVTMKTKWKPTLKFVDSTEHSVKGYADDVTLISNKARQS